MSRYIGIDYSTTSCGIAIVEAGHWQTFTIKSKPSGDKLSDYYARIQDLAYDMVAAMDLRLGDVIAIEGIAFAGKGRAVDRLHYAWHRTVEFLTRLQKTDLLIVTTNQVKQLATGRGGAQKDEVLLAAERRIPQAEVAGNDQADAVWIAVGASVLSGDPVIDLPAAHVPPAMKKALADLAASKTFAAAAAGGEDR